MIGRLIDADNITYERVTLNEGSWHTRVEMAYKMDIDAMPTIEAIPVEWLKEKLTGHPEISYALTDAIITVLEAWEQRKEE